ncbi:putative F-box/kelch-repeat protein [Raphanus sativus]|nr:putative F-box/kelch-repeat protein [Raphanus sativus]
MENWSELPSEIIYSISLRIDNLFDLIHFRSVCSFWRSSSLLKLRPTTAPKCPLPVDSGAYGDGCHVSSSRVYLVKSSSDHNGPRYWLFKLRETENGDIVLSNFFERSYCRYVNPPFSLDLLRCQVIELAQEHVACYTWSDGFQNLFQEEGRIGFMSLDADNNEFMVLGNSIFPAPTVYRSTDERWTELQITYPDAILEAIVSYKSKFYAIDVTGRTIVVEPTYLQVTTFQQSRPCDKKTRKRWLLNSGDKVLLVEMWSESHANFSIPDIREEKIWFQVSELDVERRDWNQVEDVDGRVLFLGQYCSFSCLATEIQGFRGNSIIFPDLWGLTNSIEHESIHVYEFSEQGVSSVEDIPEYVELFPFPTDWVISNA